MKKLLAMLLSLAMLLAFIPATLAEGADFSLAIEGGWVNRNLEEVDGEQLLKVDVTLSASVADPVCGLNFGLTYNTEQLTLAKYEANAAFGTVMVNDTVAGSVRYAAANTAGVTVTENMNVLSLYFKLADGLAAGDTISLALASGAYVETGDPKAPVAHDVAADFRPFECFDAEFSLVIHGGEVKDHLAELDMLEAGSESHFLTVDVDLRATVADPLCSLRFDLTYDAAQLTFAGSTANEALGSTELNGNDAGVVRYAAANANGVAVSAEVNVVTMFFELSDTLAQGDEIAFNLQAGAYAETGDPRTPVQHNIEPDFTPFVFTGYPAVEPEFPAFDGTVRFNEGEVEYKGDPATGTPYVIWDHAAGKHEPAFTVYDKDGGVVDPANYDYEYKENTMPGTGYLFVYFKNVYSGEAQLFFKIYLPASEWLTVENVEGGILLKWAAVEDAAGYVIYRRAWNLIDDGWTAFARWNNTTELTYLDGADENHKVYAGTRYQYGVKAYFARRLDPIAGSEIGGNVNEPSGNFNLGIVSPLKTTVRITTRVLNSVTAGSKQMTVKWTPSKNFTGYEIRYATDAAFTKNVKTVKIADAKTSQTVIKNLKKGTTYYVQIRSYHVFEGMTYYGGWSNTLSCKVK